MLKNTEYFSNTSTKKQRIGIVLFILPLVISQFLSINFFTFLGQVVSLEKVLALVLYPVAVLMLGIKNLRFSKELVIIGILYFLTNTAFTLWNREHLTGILGPLILVGIHMFVIFMLFNIPRFDMRSLNIFFDLWVFFSIFTAIICIIQIFRDTSVIAPVTSNTGLVRSEGLLEDPNYQAMVLLFGFSILFVEKPSVKNTIYLIVVFVGILSTMSRMGLLGVILLGSIISLLSIIKFKPIISTKTIKQRICQSLILFFIFVVLVIYVEPFSTGFNIRILDTTRKTEITTSDSRDGGDGPDTLSIIQGMTSTETRLLLIKQGLVGIKENYLVGIGFNNTNDYMKETINYPKEVHNTYLEYVLWGGITGFLLVLYSAFLVVKNLILVVKNDWYHLLSKKVFSFSVVTIIVFMFISLNKSIIPSMLIGLNFAIRAHVQADSSMDL